MLRTVVVLALALCLTARAEELAWKLGGPPPQTARYDLTIDTRPAPEPLALAPLPLLLLRQDDLGDARVPRRALEDITDVVWRYTLGLPAGDIPAKGADVGIDEAIKVGAQTYQARGAHAVKLKGKKAATIRTTVTLTHEKPPESGVRGGTLVVEKSFDLKAGRLEQATWSFEVEVGVAGKPPTTAKGTWTGKVLPGPEVVADESKALHARVNDAIQRGSTWLLKASNDRLISFKPQQSYGRNNLGSQALLTFALLRSGVPLKEVEHHFEWLHRQPWSEVYSVSLYIMALEARSILRLPVPPQGQMRSVVRYQRGPLPPRDKELIAGATRWLLAARKQGEGWWSYFGPTVEAGAPERVAGPKTPGSVGHDGKTPADSGDRSNAQFAILALHTALATGVEVPAAVWEEVLAELVKAQQERGPKVDLAGPGLELAPVSPLAFDPRDEPTTGETVERPKTSLPTAERLAGKARGWGYAMVRAAGDTEAYGSMSGAGLSSMAVAREGLDAASALTPARDRDSIVALRDGLCWFARNFDMARNVNRNADWWFYYLYSVEKAMDLAGVERVGGHEWWREGALELLARQQSNGSWGAEPNDTAFALLFLNRATLPARLEIGDVGRAASGQVDPSAWDRVILPDQKGQVSLRQVLVALGQAATPTEVKERLELAQDGWSVAEAEVRPRLVPELRTLAASAHKKVERWAREALLAVAGTEDGKALDLFTARFERLRRAREMHDAAGVADAQATLTDVAATPQLKRAALLTIDRLRAVDALGEVIAILDHRDPGLREAAWLLLPAMAGGAHHPFDPKLEGAARKAQVDAWRGWWTANGPRLVTAERARRWCADLAVDGKADAAAKELEALGRPAIRPLIDALRVDASKKRAHALLKKLGQQTFPAEPAPWLAWWEAQAAPP